MHSSVEYVGDELLQVAYKDLGSVPLSLLLSFTVLFWKITRRYVTFFVGTFSICVPDLYHRGKQEKSKLYFDFTFPKSQVFVIEFV